MAELAQLDLEFDYDEIDVEDRGYVKERAVKIRATAKKTAKGIIMIGQWLTEAKAKLPHGAWLPWLRTEFGWSERTARRFMQVAEACKSATVADLDIDVSTLYLVTSPKTPEPVVKEIIKRAEKGEPMTKAKAEAVLKEHTKRAAVPTPAVARQIAIATGKPTLASSGIYVPPMTKKQEEIAGKEQDFVWGIYHAVETIVRANISPIEMARLGEKQSCRYLADWSEQAGLWLIDVAKEARAYEATSEDGTDRKSATG
jgi:Protein of unknown function (DUF3102)